MSKRPPKLGNPREVWIEYRPLSAVKKWPRNPKGGSGPLSSCGDIMLMVLAVAFDTKCNTIAYIKAFIWIIGKGAKMMGVKSAAPNVAVLASIIIPLKNVCAPFFIGNTKTLVLPTFPSRMLFGSLPAGIIEHSLSPFRGLGKALCSCFVSFYPSWGFTSGRSTHLLFVTPKWILGAGLNSLQPVITPQRVLHFG